MLNPARILTNHAEQSVLFSEYFISNRLPANQPVYAFKELIQKLDLTILNDEYSREGDHMFSPRDLFAVVSYGFTKGICSSYQLADAVAHRMDFIYLAGRTAPKTGDPNLARMRVAVWDITDSILAANWLYSGMGAAVGQDSMIGDHDFMVKDNGKGLKLPPVRP